MIWQVYEQIESDDCLCVNLAHKTAVFYQALARYNTTVHGASQKNIKHLLAAHQNVIEQNDVINRLNEYVLNFPLCYFFASVTIP